MNADRVIGSLLGMAAGDAPGAGYEFTHPGPTDAIEMLGGGGFGWSPGEWTDDTQMAMCIAEEAATGDLDPHRVGDRFLEWLRSGPRDVGIQTSAVLGSAESGSDLACAAGDHAARSPKSAGNGSLMRTAPVALAHLGDPPAIADAARSISDLTHGDPLCGDACVLWSVAIDHAIATGERDVRIGLPFLPPGSRSRWEGLITNAETKPPGTFKPNGFVVTAFQAAWSAIAQTPIPEQRPARHLRNALVAAVRIGHDTDTVAAIAGGLLGASWGGSAVPLTWKRKLHGWPGYTARDLGRLAVLAASNGASDSAGWPAAASLLPHYFRSGGDPVALAIPGIEGVTWGNVHAISTTDASVVVSLCRMGSEGVRPPDDHVDVLLLDDPDPTANPNLLTIVEDTVDAVASWVGEGESVFVHCVEAQSRTPLMAGAYLIRHRGRTPDQALSELSGTIGRPMNPRFVKALEEIQPS